MSTGLLAELAGDLTGQDVKEVEESTITVVERGKYHAVLNEVDDEIISTKGNKGIELSFSLLGGKRPGKMVSHTLYTQGKDAAATKTLMTQINLFALRLGIAVKDEAGKTKYLSTNFRDAIGRECILDVTVESGTNEKTGRPWEANGVKFCGIFPIDDEKARQGAFMGSAAAVEKAAEKRKEEDLGDLDV